MLLSYHISQIIPEEWKHLECLYELDKYNKDIIILGQYMVHKLYDKIEMPLHPT